LLDWAGHRSGGVKRLFYEKSGRPTGEVIRTSLLARLEEWTKRVAADDANAPRIVLLIGGPGNGKTEAIEFAICELDKAMGVDGALTGALRAQFLPPNGKPPRIASIDLDSVPGSRARATLNVVQDASETDPQRPGQSAPTLLVEDLRAVLGAPASKAIYLACINRGILDDAFIYASEDGNKEVGALLQQVVQSVGMGPDAAQCWPLAGNPVLAVWPMDIESLVEVPGEMARGESPAGQILSAATDGAKWPANGSCAAGERCPFCASRLLLSSEPHRSSFLKMLRWYEFATGKRWTFRDLYSLYSFALAGVPPAGFAASSYDPCEWAAQLVEPSASVIKREATRLSAPYLLVAAQYQHALFGRWDTEGHRGFRRDLRELQLEDEPALIGLYHYLAGARNYSIPPTLEQQLKDLGDGLDPALADPDTDVEISSRTTIRFRELDMRFSHSIREGLLFVARYHALSQNETELLKRLESAEKLLSEGDMPIRHPATAARVGNFIRSFACRMARRTLGCRAALFRDASLLADYQRVANGDPVLLLDSAKQVEALLNDKDRFVVTLNTTFGEPLPPVARRAVLTTAKQKVKPREQIDGGRPRPAVRFLGVGAGGQAQVIPLTYELFKSVRELRRGMSPASLPRPVVALLDTTRAKLAGGIVRDDDALDGAEIRIGTREEVIARELGQFLVRTGDAS